MSDWINHVKKTQQEKGCSYKDALQEAKQTYGGKLPIKKAVSGGEHSWLACVKAYRQKHVCSYKDALKGAKLSYKK